MQIEINCVPSPAQTSRLPQHVPVNREAQGAAVAHRHKGVILVLRGRNIGLELNVSVSGVEISLR